MINCMCRCSNHWSALHQSEPIGARFTLRGNNPVTCPSHQRKVCHFSACYRHRLGVTVAFIGYINTPRTSSAVQIPIAI